MPMLAASLSSKSPALSPRPGTPRHVVTKEYLARMQSQAQAAARFCLGAEANLAAEKRLLLVGRGFSRDICPPNQRGFSP